MTATRRRRRTYFNTGRRSTEFSTSGRTHDYLLKGVPAALWRQVQTICKAQGVSVRTGILRLLAKLVAGEVSVQDEDNTSEMRKR